MFLFGSKLFDYLAKRDVSLSLPLSFGRTYIDGLVFSID